ncbi:MAG: hypothetical protein D6739_11585, partial [Nitrospirae bacterium]
MSLRTPPLEPGVVRGFMALGEVEAAGTLACEPAAGGAGLVADYRGGCPLLLPEGEVLPAAGRWWTVARSLLVPPRTRLRIPVSLVEPWPVEDQEAEEEDEGALWCGCGPKPWRRLPRARPEPPPGCTLPPYARARQAEAVAAGRPPAPVVAREVAELLDYFPAATLAEVALRYRGTVGAPTSAYRTITGGMCGWLARYAGGLTAVEILGHWAAGRYPSRRDRASGAWVESLVLDPGPGVSLEWQDAHGFLAQIAVARIEPCPGVGAGATFRITGPRLVGHLLVDRGRLVHLA